MYTLDGDFLQKTATDMDKVEKIMERWNSLLPLSERDREFYLSSCKRFNAKCLYAPLALVSSDKERAAKGIALYGDGYYANFSDVEELN